MASNAELLALRKQRVATAIALGKPDRVPVVPIVNAFAAKVAGVKMAQFVDDPIVAYKAMLEGCAKFGELDGIQQEGYTPYLLGPQWLSRVKMPGIDLPEDSLWQVEEAELMTRDDYDVVIEKGYPAFIDAFQRERLGNPARKLPAYFASAGPAIKEWEARGMLVLSPGLTTIPYEPFCGGRSLRAFIMDLFMIPDKVQAAMDVAMPAMVEQTRQMIRGARPYAIWVGGWRSASQFLAPKLWERFVWPYYKKMVDVVIEEGAIAVLHFDANWTRDLARLRELPKGKCILSTDGATDIFKAKELLGDHLCIMGDVPAQLLTVGTPDDVHAYATKLIREIGPSGFILSSGCDIPFSAKLENVQAMVAAVK